MLRAGRRGRTRTDTPLTRHRLLRPARLPFRHSPAAESSAPRSRPLPGRQGSPRRCPRPPRRTRRDGDPRYTRPPMTVTATPAPEELHPPRDRGPRRSPGPRGPRGHPAPVAAHARRGLPARQGAAPHPRARPRPRGGPRRGRRAPRPGRLPRRDRRAGDHPADQRGRRGRRGGGGQAAPLQGDGPGPARGAAGRLRELQLRPRDRGHRRRQGRQGRRGPARPERDPRGRRGPRGEGRATGRSSASRAPATASRSRAARRSGCRS